MRQFLGGVLAAALLWWIYGVVAGEPAAAGASPAHGLADPGGAAAAGDAAGNSASGDAASGAAGLGSLLASTAANRSAEAAAAAGEEDSRNGGRGTAVALDAHGFQDLMAGVVAGKAAELDRAYQWLAGTALSLPQRQRLQQTLAEAMQQRDFGGALPWLGSSNAFLHSAEGRALAGQLVSALRVLPDPAAVKLGSKLLELCLRGSLERSQRDARDFVDALYRQHRGPVDRWLCDPANVEGSRSHTIAGGESLAKIAARLRKEKVLVDDGTLAILNRIANADRVQKGQRIKIPVEPIRTIVEKRSFSLAVYVGESLLRLYWVGHGEGDKTPLAEFVVGEKLAKPDWTAPDGNVYAYGDPRNVLGDYYITLLNPRHPGFGIHGTPSPETIGTMSSMGCVRMYADDIAELFRLLPRGTTVEIRASAASS